MTTLAPVKIDLSQYIERRFFEDRPHIRGRRVPVALIVHFAQANNWNVTETASNFTLTEAQVLAAFLYYVERQVEIEQQEAREQVRFEEMKRLHGRN